MEQIITPVQIPGPFYPGTREFHNGNDLTRKSETEIAQGQVVIIRGKILDQDGNPIVGATVEIWQACASGRYNHVEEINPAPLDPNFKYWGETISDLKGEYVFKTIIPGEYPAETDWTRPPHIHFKVSRIGFYELITQMYFSGHKLNDIDQILLAIPEPQRSSVIVDFRTSTSDSNTLQGVFNITMRKVRN